LQFNWPQKENVNSACYKSWVVSIRAEDEVNVVLCLALCGKEEGIAEWSE